MAEEKLQFVLELATRATGDGAQRVADDMAKIQQAIANTTDKAKVSEFAYYDLGTAIDRTRKPLEKVPEANNQVRVSSRNTSMALLELSRGFEDAQYGIRGVLNNIPSLVLSLGGTAGLAGGISIAAVALSQLSSLFAPVSQAADTAANDIQKVADKMGDVKAEKLDAAREAINTAAAEADQLRQDWDETAKADASYAAANLSNAEAIRAAGVKINEMLGIRVDHIRELEKAEAIAAEKRKVEADAAIAAENKRLIDAAGKESTQANKLAQLEQVNEKDRENLRIKLEQLGALKAQKAELEALAAQPTSTLQSTGAGSVPVETANAEAIRAAREQLANPTGRIEQLTAEIDAIRNQLKADDREIRAAAVALKELENSRVDIESAITTKTAEIVQNLEKADLNSKLNTAAEKSKEIFSVIEENFTTITTSNEQGKAAVERTKTAIADGVLTVAEQEQFSKDMIKLIGLMQSGQASGRQSVTNMINLQNTTNAELNRLNGELLRLQAVVSQIERK